MRCTNPLLATITKMSDGKNHLHILPRRYDFNMSEARDKFGDNLIALPCGKCLACRLNKAKEWAVRCVLESSLYDDNYFVTLTFDDANYIDDGKRVLEIVKYFIKKLRYRCPGVRYFGCVERGSKNNRLHSHLILFNCSLNDLKPIGSNLYESKLVSDIWPYGFNYIGEVTYSSCNYVARYSCKKVFHDCPDEKIFMSLKPGIGYKWFEQHMSEVLDDDCIYGKFGSMNVSKMPRYFEKVAQVLDASKLEAIKTARLDKSMSFTINELLNHEFSHEEDLLIYKNECLMNDYRQKGSRK